MKISQEEVKRVEDIAQRARQIQTDIAHSRHLPRECYGDEQITQLERERIFSKDWIIIGREEQIPKFGDYFTMRIAGQPILVTRNKAGEVKAFHNVCRHRGVEVAFEAGHRKGKIFSCPYHGWVYNLDGKLLDAPMMEAADGFDKEQNGLLPVQVGLWGGFIFVNLDPSAQPMWDVLGKYLEKMSFLRMEDCAVADLWEFEGPCNWKLIIENVMDAYHVALLHAGTLGKVWDNSKVKFEVLDNGSSYTEFSNPTLTADGKSRFGNLPWLPDLDPLFANSLCLPPNTMLFGRCDSMYVFHAYPLDAGRVHMQVKTLVPKQHLELPDFKERIQPYYEFTRAVLEEDKLMLISMQANFQAQQFRPGQMAPLEEGIRNFLDDWVNRVFGRQAAA